MDINYELYKVFYYVATSLSFSEASKKLFISQSAVSQSIKTLEKKLGQTLFIRSTKKVQLTAAGALLLKHIEPAMNLIARGESQAVAVDDPQHGAQTPHDHDLHQHGEHVLGAHHAAVEQREAGNGHEQHEGCRGQHPGGVAGIEDWGRHFVCRHSKAGHYEGQQGS